MLISRDDPDRGRRQDFQGQATLIRFIGVLRIRGEGMDVGAHRKPSLRCVSLKSKPWKCKEKTQVIPRSGERFMGN